MKVNICSVEAYTCKPGKTGKDCTKNCSVGFYGLACKQHCNCALSRNCDKVTGLCADGCKNALIGDPTVCYNPVVKTTHQDLFAPTNTPVMSIQQGPTYDLYSSNIFKSSQHCINVRTKCESDSLYVMLVLTSPITLYGVELTFTKFYLPTPFSISISSDKKLCFGLTSQNDSLSLTKHVFKCQRRELTGKFVVVRFITYNKTALMNSQGVWVRVCDIKALECSSRVYGPHCRHLCSCPSTDCDKVTGACPRGKCDMDATGRFCSSINIIPALPLVNNRVYYDFRITVSIRYSLNAKVVDTNKNE
ncbi:multiple epidermal growth factor-like domains protein 10 [Plakobranchus ocellatus]|uniref:Multiple epidermal growth factor-like domains protein 10 n=1 Tax=Plakobranchus ocellatus TaxID=259542 RepID=A0AAV3YHD9_9GAST|nr:multiple epidermal growth factor-like domains protein 10 [Plakobranchus ocellatus]